MDTKKDIGRLFKERFKDFEQAPDSGTWDTIASGLDGRRGRSVAIFWLQWGGMLLLILFAGGLLWKSFDTKPITDPQIEITNTPSVQQNETSSNNTEKSIANPTLSSTTEDNQQSSFTYNSSTNSTTDTSTSTTYNKQLENQSSTMASTASKTDKRDESSVSEKGRTNNNTTGSRTQELTAGGLQKSNTTPANIYNPSATVYNSNATPTGLFAINQKDRDYYTQQQATEKELLQIYKAKIQQELDEAIRQQHTEAMKAYTAWKKEQQNQAVSTAVKKTTSTTSIASNDTATEKKEKEAKVAKLPKTEEERKLDREAAVTYKWGVSPYINSLRYGSLSRGSSIDNRLERNPQEGISTTGYGVKFEFSLSEKSSVRVGFGVSPLKYQTDNFQVNIINNTVNIFQLAGISPETASQGAIATSPEALAFFTENNVVSIIQDISYLEFPADYQYRFINKRVGLSVNPGLSLFLLTDNTISAISNDGQSLNVGQETSLRDLSFAFNIGLGGYYNASPVWRFNVEPVFSYQLNPYTTDIGNFRPFYLGLQFGTTYKF